jgi:hypothetical protein
MLSADELGTDELLFDRAQARDFIDVAALVNRFGLRVLRGPVLGFLAGLG